MARLTNFKERGVLVLETRGFGEPRVFRGSLFGARVSYAEILNQCESRKGDRGFGEVVFNTSMSGYQEILTDPSYYGEIVTFTSAHIGNTGITPFDDESHKLWCSGLVVQDWNESPSSWRSREGLGNWLEKNGIPAICDVDTRALTRLLRSEGVVRGLILPESDLSKAQDLIKKLPHFEGRDLIAEVTTKQPYLWDGQSGGQPDIEAGGPKIWPGLRSLVDITSKNRSSESLARMSKKKRVVVLDFGVKWNMLRILSDLGCEVSVVPAFTSAETILNENPDGIFLSNGPGDPAAAGYAVETVRQLLGKKPIFGVCMGHQILSLAVGASTYKLKFGHRGGNQPVMDLKTRRVEISSHNHGYSVDGESLPPGVQVTHMNLNDRTVEGIEVLERAAFSVQYHPEACPGPHDSLGLFKRFMDLMQHPDREPNVPEISRTGS